jgi:CRISPR-associated endonuclease Csn1
MRILGLDCGIASVGWAVLDLAEDGSDGRIAGCGTRMFDTPETDKERRPKSELRRMYRGQRRVIRRRKQRMNAVRRLLQPAWTAAKGGERRAGLRRHRSLGHAGHGP